MKRLGVFLIIAVVMTMSFGAFKDVPRTHWAYDAVTELTKIGILTGYPDGTFKGSSVVNRYQLAVALYRTIEYIKEIYKTSSGNISTTSTVSSGSKYDTLSRKVAKNEINIANLEKIVADLRRKLENITYSSPSKTSSESDQSKLALQLAENAAMLAKQNTEKIKGIENKMSLLEEKLGGNSELVRKLQATVENLKDNPDLKELKAVVEKNEKEITTVREMITKYDKQIDTISNTVIALKNEVADLSAIKNDVRALVNKYGELSNDYVKLNEKVGELESKLSEIENMKLSLDSLKGNLSESNDKFKQLEEKVLTIEKGFKGSRENVANLEERVSNLEKKVEAVEKGGSGSSMWLSVFAFLLSVGAVAAVFLIKQ